MPTVTLSVVTIMRSHLTVDSDSVVKKRNDRGKRKPNGYS